MLYNINIESEEIIIKIAEYIQNIMKQQERQPSWVADKIGITRQAIRYKLKSDCFTAYELLYISEILPVDLEELKKKIKL